MMQRFDFFMGNGQNFKRALKILGGESLADGLNMSMRV
jgi:hypothetical protein